MNIKELIDAGKYPLDSKGRALVPMRNGETATIYATDHSIVGRVQRGEVWFWTVEGKSRVVYHYFDLLPPQHQPKSRLVWLVTETAYGKIIGWRHFLELDEALRTAGVWVSQSAGDVTISRTEVEV